MSGIWAVIPIKERLDAKQRLATLLTLEQRRILAATMFEDVMEALTEVSALAGILVVTLDADATSLARRAGARVSTAAAQDGHTCAVTAAARLLREEGCVGMLTLPGDIPDITAYEVAEILAAHRPAPSFTIVPAHDERGSNAVLCSPPDAVPLRFGDDSFHPHLAAARGKGIEPAIIRRPGIAMDIDHPADIAAYLGRPPTRPRRTRALLGAWGFRPPPQVTDS